MEQYSIRMVWISVLNSVSLSLSLSLLLSVYFPVFSAFSLCLAYIESMFVFRPCLPSSPSPQSCINIYGWKFTSQYRTQQKEVRNRFSIQGDRNNTKFLPNYTQYMCCILHVCIDAKFSMKSAMECNPWTENIHLHSMNLARIMLRWIISLTETEIRTCLPNCVASNHK